MKGYVITISREFGSGGKEIAKNLSEILGIPWYDKQIFEMASEESGINESYFVENAEHIPNTFLMNIINSKPIDYVVEPTDKDFTSNINIFNIQARLIKMLADTKSCIILGKCADFVLQDNDNVLSVFIGATRKECVRSLVEKLEVSESEAVDEILRTDRYRSDYYKYYTRGKEWKNPNNYDLCLNTGRIDRDTCCKIIIDSLKNKFGNDILDKK